MKTLSACLLLISVLFSFPMLAKEVWVIPVQGAIGPATASYINREFTQARQQQAAMVILKMDTPGGLDSAMRDIIRDITTSPIPVATWVGPSGARAASAGTYILLASHLAVMANATNLGAATPISISIQGTSSPSEDAPDNSDNDSAADSKKVVAETIHEKKAINDASAYIKGLAKLHGRNEVWAEKAVTEAASLDAQEALEINVIDYIADDIKQLLMLADKRQIKLNDKVVELALADADIIERIPDWRYTFLATLTNPNVAYILMLIGIYGLLLEFYNPGIGLPGVLGGICLLLGMYALQMLPINYAGLALILLGIALLVAEAFSPSFGILGLGGIGSFVIGSVFLLDSKLPAFQIAKPIIAGFAFVSVLFTFVVITLLLKIRRKNVTTGVQCMVGRMATVTADFNAGQGWVEIDGEIWQARCSEPVVFAQQVIIKEVAGLWLQVSPVSENNNSQ
jgi:membrane-bound serine protease (ClpP class)